MGALFEAALIAAAQNPVPAASISQVTTGQSIANATTTVITFNQSDYDTSGTAIADTANNRLIANRTGIWTASLTIRLNSGGNAGTRGMDIRLNGTTYIVGANTTATGTLVLNCSKTLRLAAGDYLQGTASQGTGAAITMDLSTEPVSLTLAFNGPA